jgi:hypothetical protein
VNALSQILSKQKWNAMSDSEVGVAKRVETVHMYVYVCVCVCVCVRETECLCVCVFV